MVKTLHARAATGEKDFEEYEGESEPNMKFSHALIVVLLLHVLAVGGVFAFNALKGRHLAPDRSKPAAQAVAAPAPEPAAVPANKAAAPAHETARTLLAAPAKAPSKALPETAAATHTVVAGDTLTRIAAGNKTTVEAIEQANGLGSGSALRIGQTLKIPAKTGASKAPAKQEAPAAKTADAKTAAATKTSETKPATAAKTTDAKTAAANKTADAKPAASAVKNPDVKPAPAAKTKEATAAAKPADSEPAKADAPASDKSYTVAKGDNPYAIAKKLKVKYNDLIKANDIKDPTKLQIGQKLIIP